MLHKERILIVSHDQPFIHLMKVTLDLSYDYEIVTCRDCNDALKKLPLYEKSLKCFIYLNKPQDFSFSDVLQWLTNKSVSTKVLIIAEDVSAIPSEFKEHKFVLSAPKEVFVREFDQFFKVIFKDEVENPGEYIEIEIDSILKIDGIESDAYIKVSSGKYIKLVTKGDRMTSQEIHRYKMQNIHHLYIKKETAKRIKEQISKQVGFFLTHPGFRFVVRSPDDPLSKRFEQKIIRCNEDFLIDHDFQKQLEGVISKTMETITKIPKIETLLKTLNEKRHGSENYLGEHMLLLSYVTSAWSMKLGWHSMGTREKLIFASILHDITLGGHPHLAKIRDKEEFDKQKLDFSKAEQELFLNHPTETAQLISSFFQLAPADTDVIIRQHHELPNGRGFPKKLTWAKIPPLSSLFILAHEYVHCCLLTEMPKAKIIEHLKTRFAPSAFQKMIKALEVLVSEEKI